MADTPSMYTNITSLDVHLASRYFPILVRYAKARKMVFYGDLVEEAKLLYQDDTNVQNAIPVSTGRRLDVVRLFTQEHKLLDLTALVINRGTLEVGDRFPKGEDPVAIRKQIFNYDWNAVSTEFEGFVVAKATEIKPRKMRKESEARQISWDFYVVNKSFLPSKILLQKDFIIDLLKEGFSAEEAYHLAKNNLSA